MAEEGSQSESRATAALDHVLKGIQDAVVKAQQLANQQHFQMLEAFVRKQDPNDDDSPWLVRTLKLLIDQPQKGRDEDGKVRQALFEVPIVSLVPVQTLSLKELEIRMQLRITHVNPPSRLKEGAHPDKNQEVEFKVDMAATASKAGVRDGRMIDVTMKFVGQEAPEGILRLIERINESIVEKEPPESNSEEET